MRTLLTNAKIVTPDEIIDGSILMDNGHIISIMAGNNPQADARNTYDCHGSTIVPGLIDMHVHFRDPGQAHKEDIETGAKAAVAGGVTTACCMANTNPVNDNAAITSYIFRKGQDTGLIDLYPIGAVTTGLKGHSLAEMGLMIDAGAVAFSDDGKSVDSSLMMRKAMEYAKGFNTTIISHNEDTNLRNNGACHEGANSHKLGIPGIPSETEEIMIIRNILLAKLTKCHLHIAHVSTATGLELIKWAKEQNINITCEVTPHHLHLTDESIKGYDTNYKVNPPLRESHDVDYLRQSLRNGLIDVIATDHSPHHFDEKNTNFNSAPFGIIGLQTMVPLLLDLVRENYITMHDFVRLTSSKPAKILGLSDRGELKEGMRADIAVINTDHKYTYDTKLNRSKSTNSPFIGKKMRGIVTHTFKNGELVYELNN